MLRRLLKDLHTIAYNDNWGGDLIKTESHKIHQSYQTTVQPLLAIVNNPQANDFDRMWAKNKLDQLI